MHTLGPPGHAGPLGKNTLGKNTAGQELYGVRSSGSYRRGVRQEPAARGWWSNLSVRVLILKSARNLPENLSSPIGEGRCSAPLREQLADVPWSRPNTPGLTCKYGSACAVSTMLAKADRNRPSGVATSTAGNYATDASPQVRDVIADVEHPTVNPSAVRC